MTQLFRLLSTIAFLGLFTAGAARCQGPGSCPVLPTLATSKLIGNQDKENLVIWFFNQGRKTTRGVQFELFMLDGVGNRYPASQRYIATGTVKPQDGDAVAYSTDTEKEHFGQTWEIIEGIEVRVTRVMFKDGSVWMPQKGHVCKAQFMNDEYKAEIDRRWDTAGKKVEQQQKQKN